MGLLIEVVFLEKTGAHGKELHAFAKLLKSALLARPPPTGTLSRPSGIWSMQGKWSIARLANQCKERLHDFKNFTYFITHTYTVNNA